jgi:hypothetical protein
MGTSDRLFVYRPGFTDEGQHWFCPFSAQVIGYLAYYPAVRATVELVELGFEKPRRPLVDLVGEGKDSLPCLVLGNEAPAHVEGVTIGEHVGNRFVTKTIEILRYLAVTRGTPPPH